RTASHQAGNRRRGAARVHPAPQATRCDAAPRRDRLRSALRPQETETRSVILVDTSVWSLTFRRRSRPTIPPVAALVHELILDDAPLVVPGIVLQELLSGVRDPAQ